MTEKITAGALSLKAASDTTKYDSLEIGHALKDDVGAQLLICARRHRDIFDEKEYCVGYVLASDPMIRGVMRRKYFAMLYLPSPRPSQAVFLYNKIKDEITKRLWVLPCAFSPNPNVWSMEKLYLESNVPSEYHTMKAWSQAFYDLKFWPFIRKQHNIKMLSEIEYLNANREELVKASTQKVDPGPTESFDFGKISVNKIVNTQTTVAE